VITTPANVINPPVCNLDDEECEACQ
jgi:hypothetical protein